MHPVDHIFVLLLFLVQPIYGVFEARYYEAQVKAGRSVDRLRFYRDNALVEWAFLAALCIAWFALGRPFADLGLVSPGGTGFWVGAALLGFGVGVLVYSWRGVRKASGSEKHEQAKSLGKLVHFLPHTLQELHGFIRVSITAGIVEEIVYRGFLIWYLAQLMPLWAAVALSSLGFGLAHSYQGASGALRCGLVGLAFGIYYVGTGSIWLPILAHVLLDVLQGATIYELLRTDTDTSQPELAGHECADTSSP